MQTLTICPICRTTELVKSISCIDYTVSKKIFSLTQCSHCQFLFTNPQPEEQELSEYYQSQDYISHTAKGNNLINKLYLLVRSFTLKSKVKLINQFSDKGSILDVGCGTGEFLFHAKKNGWKTTGVEPSPEARAMAVKKMDSIFESLEKVDSTNFDIITLWHVLEHVPNLNETLALLKNKLSSTGTLIIAVPNFESHDAQYYKEYWAGYDVPRHLWHFNCSSVNELSSRHSLHLNKILPMKWDAFYVSLLSEKYKKDNHISFPQMIRGFYNGLKSNMKAKKTNQYSSLIYILTP